MNKKQDRTSEDVAQELGVVEMLTQDVMTPTGFVGQPDRIRDVHTERIVRLQMTPWATVVSSRLWTVTVLGEIAPDEQPTVVRLLHRLSAALESHGPKTVPHPS